MCHLPPKQEDKLLKTLFYTNIQICILRWGKTIWEKLFYNYTNAAYTLCSKDIRSIPLYSWLLV